MKQDLQASALMVISLAIFIAASLTVFAEGRVFFSDRLDQRERLASVLNDATGFGPSTYSKRLYLDDCLEALTSVRGRTLPATERVTLSTACRENALKIIATHPPNGFAHYMAALASAAIGEEQAFNEYLAASREVSPNEGWLAELRIKLSDEHERLLDDGNQSNMDQDIATLAQSNHGAGWLARKALVDDAFRERAITVLETLPPSSSRRFVNAFRAAVNGRD